MAELEFVIRDGPSRGHAHPFPGPRFVIGSGPGCQLRFPASLVASRHAEVSTSGSAVHIRDLSGASLLWIDGQRTAGGTLAEGSQVRLGRLDLVVRRCEELGAAKTRLSPRATDVSREPVEWGPLRHGDLVDARYQVLGTIAAGGMGIVYKVQHVELGKVMALKLMLPRFTEDPDFVSRFKQEAVAASHIGQQNIVEIFDFGRTAEGQFYFVMEYLDGTTLAGLLQGEGRQPARRVVSITIQIAHALAAAHRRGIIHCDLKPDNIMVLQRPGQPELVKVLDFGVAKVVAGPRLARHTQVGIMMGTPRYMSPEQAQGRALDARSDIYALGLIVYELLAGQPLIRDTTQAIVMLKDVIHPLPPFEPDVRAALPRALESLVFEMLQREASGRPQRMEDVIDRLEQLGGRVAIEPRKRPSLRLAAAGSGVVAAALVGAALLTRALPAATGGGGPTVTPRATDVPPPAPPATPPQALIAIRFTTPGGSAEVYQDDALVGTTPLTVKASAGTTLDYSFVRKGHEVVHRKVRFTSDGEVFIELPALPALPGPGATAAPPSPRPAGSSAEREAHWRKAFADVHRHIAELEASMASDRQRLHAAGFSEGDLVRGACAAPDCAVTGTQAVQERLVETRDALARARRTLEDLEREASHEAVPREWRTP